MRLVEEGLLREARLAHVAHGINVERILLLHRIIVLLLGLIGGKEQVGYVLEHLCRDVHLLVAAHAQVPTGWWAVGRRLVSGWQIVVGGRYVANRGRR